MAEAIGPLNRVGDTAGSAWMATATSRPRLGSSRRTSSTSRPAGGRCLLYTNAVSIDLARHHPDQAEQETRRELVDLLTPISKAWCTDLGVELASIGLQVHGGMGYVEETGVVRYLRNSRISPIYEATNGIQAIDLFIRKVPMPDGGPAGPDGGARPGPGRSQPGADRDAVGAGRRDTRAAGTRPAGSCPAARPNPTMSWPERHPTCRCPAWSSTAG